MFHHNERVGQRHGSFKDKVSVVPRGERPVSLCLPVVRGDTPANLEGCLPVTGAVPRGSEHRAGSKNVFLCFFFLPKQTSCPSVSTHALYELVSLLTASAARKWP